MVAEKASFFESGDHSNPLSLDSGIEIRCRRSWMRSKSIFTSGSFGFSGGFSFFCGKRLLGRATGGGAGLALRTRSRRGAGSPAGGATSLATTATSRRRRSPLERDR